MILVYRISKLNLKRKGYNINQGKPNALSAVSLSISSTYTILQLDSNGPIL